MQYIVLDLEWNQAMSSKSPVFNKLPIHLRGEIIQIGAVKLRDDMSPGDTFQIDIKPIYFRHMHYKVKKLTGFDKERLSGGSGFKEAFESFKLWCGDNCTFLTWGYDDKGIMEQNIIIHDLDWDWIAGWINLQVLHNIRAGGDRNQKSLVSAMEHYAIEPAGAAHDALDDAYNAALVCARLDLEESIPLYDDTVRLLSMGPSKNPDDNDSENPSPIPLDHVSFSGFPSKRDAFADSSLTRVLCPNCGTPLVNASWINQGDKRYMTLSSCKKHGDFLIRLKFRKTEDDSWTANRIVYKADERITEFYKSKSGDKKRLRKKRAGRKLKLKKRE
ncbi:MAG: exonuclease domain-containing protein [Oscillospiraceae bacterium]|nr:exonuclease domain-containing protein [Oscillospiraceae bacterium]